jgi:hypothetical protein
VADYILIQNNCIGFKPLHHYFCTKKQEVAESLPRVFPNNNVLLTIVIILAVAQVFVIVVLSVVSCAVLRIAQIFVVVIVAVVFLRITHIVLAIAYILIVVVCVFKSVVHSSHLQE